MSYTPMELAAAFIKTGELDDALLALSEQLAQQPNDMSARRLRVQVLLRLGTTLDLQQALTDWQALPEPTTADYVEQSIIYERLDELPAAIMAMQTASTTKPHNERLAERLLMLMLKAERLEEALALVRQQGTSNWRWLEREGDVLVALGDDTLATARYGLVLAKLEQLAGTLQANYLQALRGRVLLARAHAYRRLDYLDIAREHYEAAQLIFPQDPVIPFNLGLLLAMAGERAEATEQCRAAYGQASVQLQVEMQRSVAQDPRHAWLAEVLA